MKKVIALILLLILSFFIVSCDKNSTSNTVKEINKSFVLDDSIKSNYIYQHSSLLKISGQCEPGGKLFVNLYSKWGISVSNDSCIVDENGEFLMEIKTPNGSFDKYTIVIKDYHEKYVQKFEDILFGEITLLLGDHLINESVVDAIDDSFDEEFLTNVFYMDKTNDEKSWKNVESLDELNSFSYYLSSIFNNTLKYRNMPIGFINVLYDETTIEQWISLEDVNSNESIKNYLIETSQYFENPYHNGQMSFIYNHIIDYLFDYSFGNIVYSSGVNDFIRLSSDKLLLHLEQIYLKKVL